MIDALKMLADCPAALHREVKDAGGVWHDCVITQTRIAPELTQMGIAFSGDSDTVFVASPFQAPAGERLSIRYKGATTTRRVDSVTDNIDFLAFVLGEAV